MDNIILYILLVLNLFSFLLGYLYGYFRNLSSNKSWIAYSKSDKKQKHNTVESNDISIDDKKVILNIDTKGLEKKYEELGDKKITEDNISSSVNKLKNLKR
jgi:hypothetical protein